MKKITQDGWWAITGISFFAAFLLFAQNESAFADAHNLGKVYIGGGIVLTLLALFGLYKVSGKAKPMDG